MNNKYNHVINYTSKEIKYIKVSINHVQCITFVSSFKLNVNLQLYNLAPLS